jgi:transposase-like protein
MNNEEIVDPEIEKIRSTLVEAIGKFPFAPREIPPEFRKKILAFISGGGSSRNLSAAIGINASNFSLWKTELRPKLQEVKVIPEPPKAAAPLKITFSDSKKQFSIEGLKFDEIRCLLRERLL